MDILVEKFRGLLQHVDATFKRSLFNKINWTNRAICILGARGVGKSTLMLQYVKEQLPLEKTLYLTLDDLYFRTHTLTEVSEQFYKLGGRYLFLDEVHKYPEWQREVKNLYDFKKDLQIVVSGSSILALQTSSADLSRRMVNYHLPALSFREYLALKEGLSVPAYNLVDIVENHETIVPVLLSQIVSPLAHYVRYARYGAYPFFLEGESDYYVRISQLINLIIDYDLPEARAIEGASLSKLKKLLYILSQSVPFTPNIQKLSEGIGTSRNRVLEMLDILEKSQLIRNLRTSAAGFGLMNKPDKIYLNNSNLIHALADEKPDTGNIRETLFFAHTQDAGLRITFPKSGDFLINEKYLFEVGGKNKTGKQIKEQENSFIVSDSMEYGVGRKIPLWVFGLLY